MRGESLFLNADLALSLFYKQSARFLLNLGAVNILYENLFLSELMKNLSLYFCFDIFSTKNQSFESSRFSKKKLSGFGLDFQNCGFFPIFYQMTFRKKLFFEFSEKSLERRKKTIEKVFS